MDSKITLVLLLCLFLPQLCFPQSFVASWAGNNPHRVDNFSNSRKNYTDHPRLHREPSNWKTYAIIAGMVLFFGGIVYGTNCFYICKWHFFERQEKTYTKIDSCANA